MTLPQTPESDAERYKSSHVSTQLPSQGSFYDDFSTLLAHGKMKFTAVFGLIMFSLLGIAAADVAAPVAPRDASPGPISPREVPALLEKAKRSCTPSNCLCNKVEGLFCGDEKVNPACLNDDVYQCSTTGKTCVYGYRTSCAKCGKLEC